MPANLIEEENISGFGSVCGVPPQMAGPPAWTALLAARIRFGGLSLVVNGLGLPVMP